MKILFTIFIYLFPFLLFSQDSIELSLKSGDFTLEKTLEIDNLDSDSYRLITFNSLPTESEKVELNELGIDFLYYLPKNTFAVSLQNNIGSTILSDYDIVSVNNFEPFFVQLLVFGQMESQVADLQSCKNLRKRPYQRSH